MIRKTKDGAGKESAWVFRAALDEFSAKRGK
jgi:hypothetical protein